MSALCVRARYVRMHAATDDCSGLRGTTCVLYNTSLAESPVKKGVFTALPAPNRNKFRALTKKVFVVCRRKRSSEVVAAQS